MGNHLGEAMRVDEWLSLFDDPILGNSALDRLANASYQVVSRAPATGNGCLHIVPYWASQEVIDRPTTT